MAHEDLHAHRAADDEYVATPGSSYEHTDANIWAIAKFGFWLVVTAIVVHVGVGLMYRMLVEQAIDTTEQRYPLAAGNPSKLPPEPRLQESPRQEIQSHRAAEAQRLSGYGWVDKEAGVVHIPIEEAMRLTVERGLPVRPVPPDEPVGTAAPMMPADSSAGRTLVRRRQ
jgi:hypothetical protein